ncbi:ob-fold nucleic acid binding domain [Diplodia corticola]|uniref:Ob-fold nucleic acid binding domain n=1 Tax=Diplodia corticola TaxID=236234 RepID=A0A1J9S820_9PEZI|nr:ob-fold nucleic acid binding domain [Diplodia corticola]OJD36639.1 ob-fold nucleic acid binding domain [Diplodia corticola]
MTTSAGATPLQFYPERYYSASPTYNTWVKLTAAAVHRLRPASSLQAEPAISRTDNFFDSTIHHPTFYHLNHPIRFVRLVGTVVAIEDLGPRFVILTLDDGSGATLELKITRLSPAEEKAAAAAAATTTTTTSSTTNPGTLTTSSTNPASSTTTTLTTAADVTVRSAIGLFEVAAHGARVGVGSTLKAKCTLGTFRGATQGVLRRCWVLPPGTRGEAAEWRGTAAFMRGVLAAPWVLGAAEREGLEGRWVREREREREREEVGRREREGRERRRGERGERARRREERREGRRRKEEVLMNGGALV